MDGTEDNRIDENMSFLMKLSYTNDCCGVRNEKWRKLIYSAKI
jgi:hypothetical protein